MDSYSSTLAPLDVVSSREERRKFILRGWSLAISILATMMALTMVDERMAYMQGSYMGYVGIWINCRKHQCASLGQVTVLIHMSAGFMMLALTLCLVLLPTMGVSFRPVFRRLHRIDLVFSSLSFSIGLLIVLSLTLFVVNCEMLRPRPQVSYLATTYLCWGAGALMLSAGALSYLNHVGVWSKGTSTLDQWVSYRWRVSQQSTLRHVSQQQSDADPTHTVDLPNSLTPQVPPRTSLSNCTRASQDTNL